MSLGFFLLTDQKSRLEVAGRPCCWAMAQGKSRARGQPTRFPSDLAGWNLCAEPT